MFFTPVKLELKTASSSEQPANIDLLARTDKLSTLAVAACVEWENPNSTPGRDKLIHTLQESISALIEGDKYGARSRTHDLVLSTNYKFRSATELPSGLKGLSLLVANNGGTSRTSRPYVMFTNYVGTTASYIPGYSDDLSGPYSGFLRESQVHKGLFLVSEAKINRLNSYGDIRMLADMHTLAFKDNTKWGAYVGQKPALEMLAQQSIVDTDPIPTGVVAIHATPVA